MTIDDFANQHRLQIQRDPHGATAIIPGRKGKSHLFEYGEGLMGVAILPDTQTGHRWSAARSAFAESGMSVRQDGDQEGVASFDPQNLEQVCLALKYADVKRRRKVSEEERHRLAELGFKKPPARVPSVPQNESANTVEGEKTV